MVKRNKIINDNNVVEYYKRQYNTEHQYRIKSLPGQEPSSHYNIYYQWLNFISLKKLYKVIDCTEMSSIFFNICQFSLHANILYYSLNEKI